MILILRVVLLRLRRLLSHSLPNNLNLRRLTDERTVQQCRPRRDRRVASLAHTPRAGSLASIPRVTHPRRQQCRHRRICQHLHSSRRQPVLHKTDHVRAPHDNLDLSKHLLQRPRIPGLSSHRRLSVHLLQHHHKLDHPKNRLKYEQNARD